MNNLIDWITLAWFVDLADVAFEYGGVLPSVIGGILMVAAVAMQVAWVVVLATLPFKLIFKMYKKE